VAFYIDVVDIIDRNIAFVKCERGANLMSLKAAAALTWGSANELEHLRRQDRW
jgi:hypothetical protein